MRGSAPKPPGFTAFSPPEWLLADFKGTGLIARPQPFRPLNRSLGLLPSIALSRPVQVGSVSTTSLVASTKNQRTAITPLTWCLTFGVHRIHVVARTSPAVCEKRVSAHRRE